MALRVLLMVVPHTFGRHLTFNAHLHILVSGSGLKESEGLWVADLPFAKRALMHIWRFAVITYLRAALAANLLTTDMSTAESIDDAIREHHLVPIRLTNMPLWLYFRSVSSSEKSVKL